MIKRFLYNHFFFSGAKLQHLFEFNQYFKSFSLYSQALVVNLPSKKAKYL